MAPSVSVVSFDVGRCDPVETCPIFQCSGNTCSVTICGPLSGVTEVPQSVPIKTLIKGSILAPFVRMRFEYKTDKPDTISQAEQDTIDASTEITTGNVSQPYNSEICRAAIKAFQYGWGATQSGNTCKITVVDEAGSQFNAWFRRVTNNVEAAADPLRGFYRMKVQWGWIVSGNDQGCPATVNVTGVCTDTPETNYSTSPQTLICSPPCWFLPNSITVNVQQNGKFIYEIEGVDLMQRASEHATPRVYNGSGTEHFVNAIKKLAADSTPQFNVDFLQVNETTGDIESLKFFVPPNTASGVGVITASDPDVENLGPKMIWSCKEANPLAVINQWLSSVRAQTANGQGRGITMNWDSNYENPSINRDNGKPVRYGRFIVWADALPTGLNANFDIMNRIRALYTINSGSCSPVFSFTPTLKGNFTAAGLRAGGLMGTNTGQTIDAIEGVPTVGASFGSGLTNRGVIPQPAYDAFGKEVGKYIITNMNLNRRANVLYHTVEAELRVQGDPSLYYCTPIHGYGRCVALVVINPFSLERQLGADCPDWSFLSTGTCNDLLTNRAWFIMGCDHQIKEGSYVTVLKLMLMMPGVDAIAKRGNSPMPIGGDPNAPTLCGNISGQGNIPDQNKHTCINAAVLGNSAVVDGVHEYCETIDC
jgi:hypothetical protein